MHNSKVSLAFFVVVTLSCIFACEAYAQSYLSPGYIFGEIRREMGFYEMPEAPDFVKAARRDAASLDYKPLQPPPREFHNEAMKPAQRLEAEAPAIKELETARASSLARASAERSGALSKNSSKSLAKPSEDDPAPMKWNPWDTE